MLSPTHTRIAADLHARIGQHAQHIGTGIPAARYHALVAESDAAYATARYLSQHLALSEADRRAFAQACGIGGWWRQQQ